MTGCTSLLVSEEAVGEDETIAEVVDSPCFSSAHFASGYFLRSSRAVSSATPAPDVLRQAIALAGS